MKRVDITGQRFGRLIVLSVHGKTPSGKVTWLCECDCGTQLVKTGSNMKYGNCYSCGCLSIELTKTRNATHGETRRVRPSLEYHTWASMKKRCSNPNDSNFHNYGGRGIKVCARWEQFENFLSDMGRKPSPTYSIDRIDVNGDYEPSNCRWATAKEQGVNRRTNRLVHYHGKIQTISQWSKELGINGTTIYQRLKYGWTMEEALSVQPVRNQ